MCQFLAWTGVEEAKWTPEQRAERGIERAQLSLRDKNVLQSMRLSVVTALGTATAHTTLAAELPKLGIDFDELVFSEEMDSDAGLQPELEAYMRDVGTSTLVWVRHGMRDPGQLSADQLTGCNRDALGYRGAKALVSTPLNVPVGTLTALWCPGFYRGEPWSRANRRGYIDKLIIA